MAAKRERVRSVYSTDPVSVDARLPANVSSSAPGGAARPVSADVSRAELAPNRSSTDAGSVEGGRVAAELAPNRSSTDAGSVEGWCVI